MYIDIALIAYCLLGARRGMHRKLSGVLYRLFLVSTAAVSGVSLFKVTGKVIASLVGNVIPDSLGFLVSCALPLAVVRKGRERLAGFIDKRLGTEGNRLWGAVAGFATRFILGLVPLLVIVLSKTGWPRDMLLRGSYLARMLDIFTG